MNETSGLFGGAGMMVFFLFFLLAWGGGFGGFGGNGLNAAMAGNMATQNDVQRGFDAQNSVANQREILAAVTNGTAQSVAATNQSFHDTLGVLQDKYGELQRDIASLSVQQAQSIANQNQCCCDTKLLIQGIGAETNANIAQSRYDAALNTAGINANIAQSQYEAAMNTAAINANTTAQTQKILDAITGNRMADMQNQINQLQLQNAVSGVVRYPSASTYYAGNNPFCGCGCMGA